MSKDSGWYKPSTDRCSHLHILMIGQSKYIYDYNNLLETMTQLVLMYAVIIWERNWIQKGRNKIK